MFRPEMLRPMGLPEDVNVIAWGLGLERYESGPPPMLSASHAHALQCCSLLVAPACFLGKAHDLECAGTRLNSMRPGL